MPTMGTASAATGVICMVLLSAVVVLGILEGRRVRLAGLPRFAGLSWHRSASLLAVGFLAIHILTAVVAPYARIGPAAAIIPFASGYEGPWLALGAVAADLVVALIVTSLLRRHLSFRTWRAVHCLAYACWPTALAHSIRTGGGCGTGDGSARRRTMPRRSEFSARSGRAGRSPGPRDSTGRHRSSW
jgi:methionine sulfoxide reductase heme-binding subunit